MWRKEKHGERKRNVEEGSETKRKKEKGVGSRVNVEEHGVGGRKKEVHRRKVEEGGR